MADEVGEQQARLDPPLVASAVDGDGDVDHAHALRSAPRRPRACSRPARTGRRSGRARRRPRAPASRATPPSATRSPFRATQTTAKSPSRCAMLRERGRAGRRREAHLDEQLARLERGREHRDEELLGRDRPPARDELRAERERADRQLGGRVGVDERAADRPAAARRRVADVTRARRAAAGTRPAQCSRSHCGSSRRRRARRPRRGSPPAPELAPRSTSADGRREPEVQHRDEALPAGERLRVLVRGQERERLVERRRPVVLERRRLHREQLPEPGRRQRQVRGLDARAAAARRRPRSRPRRARSPTLDSPQPFAPTGVNGDGVSMCAMSIRGASAAVSTR